MLSVIEQSRAADEILIVDDASTDGSQDILTDLAAEFPAIKVQFRQTNLGAGGNRHEGFISADGPLVTNLAGDDTIDRDKVKNECFFIEEKGADLAFSDMELVYPNGTRHLVSTAYFAELDKPADRVTAMLTRAHPLPHHMVYAKSLYQEVGGYDVTATLYEDWSLKLRLAASEAKWMHSGKIGLKYNRHGTGLSSSPGILHTFWRLYVIGRNWGWLTRMVSKEAIVTGCRVAFDPWGQGQVIRFDTLRQAWLRFLDQTEIELALLHKVGRALQIMVEARSDLLVTESVAHDFIFDALVVASAHQTTYRPENI